MESEISTKTTDPTTYLLCSLEQDKLLLLHPPVQKKATESVLGSNFRLELILLTKY